MSPAQPRRPGKGAPAGTVPAAAAVGPEHRGRLQVQGLDIDENTGSYAWSQATPIPAATAVAELDALHAGCTPEQQRSRARSFPKARRFIDKLAGRGIDGPVYKTWADPGVSPKYARVDIEVITGRAFV